MGHRKWSEIKRAKGAPDGPTHAITPEPGRHPLEPDLLSDLRSPETARRIWAAFALGNGRPSKATVRGLRAALTDSDAEVRDQAAAALGALGDVDSLPQLRPLLDQAPPSRTKGTAWAMSQLAHSADAIEREEAVRALEMLRRRARGKAREHVEFLLRNRT
jgi:HEAT repeat protein